MWCSTRQPGRSIAPTASVTSRLDRSVSIPAPDHEADARREEPKPTPARPIAGRSFTLRLVAARSDTGAVVQNGRAICVGRVGSARLKATVQRVQGGAATCTWNLPRPRRQDLPRVGERGLRGTEGVAELHREGPLAPPPVRRLALASLVAVVMSTGTAAGRRSLATQRRRAGATEGSSRAGPLCVRARAREPSAGHPDARRPAARGRDLCARFAGLGVKRKLNVHTTIARRGR